MPSKIKMDSGNDVIFRLFGHRSRYAYFYIGLFILIGIVLILAIFTGQFGSSGNRQSSVKQIFYADNISNAHREIIDRYNQLNKGRVEVVPVHLPFTKFSTNERKVLLARSLRSKTDRLDLFAVDVIWAHRFARWAYPLEEIFKDDKMPAIFEEALNSCYFEDKLVAMPMYTDIGIMYYNDAVLQSFPEYQSLKAQIDTSITWEALFRLRQKYSRRQHPFYLFPAKNYEGLICSFIELLGSQQGSIFHQDSVRLNTAVSRRSLQLLVDLVGQSGMTPAIVTEFDEINCYEYALEHNALLFRGWPGLHQQPPLNSDPEKLKMIKPAPLPHFEGSLPVAVFGGWNLMVSKYSKHKPEAIDFIKFVLQEKNQKILTRSGGYIPVNKAVYQDSLFLESFPELAFFRDLLASGVHRPYSSKYTKISDILSYYLNMAIKGEIAVNEALNKATRDINSKRVLIR